MLTSKSSDFVPSFVACLATQPVLGCMALVAPMQYSQHVVHIHALQVHIMGRAGHQTIERG